MPLRSSVPGALLYKSYDILKNESRLIENVYFNQDKLQGQSSSLPEMAILGTVFTGMAVGLGILTYYMTKSSGDTKTCDV